MDFQRLDQLIQTMPERGFPACDLAVTWKGEPVYRAKAGYSDTARTKPVSEKDIYYVFSISKITTCTAAMRLVEEGRLGLDDPVSKYLPAYENLQVAEPDGTLRPVRTPMTIRHLFAMTGGLDYNFNRPELLQARQGNPHITTQEFVNLLPQFPLRFEPGEHFNYSLCHDVLAAVTEVVSGKRFADYVREIILEPLGMSDTAYHLPPEKADRLTAMYRYVPGLSRSEPVPTNNAYIFSDCYDSGGAGLSSTVNDQMHLLTTLANHGTSPDGYRLLKPETVAEMGKGQLSDSARPDFGVTRLPGYSWGLCGRAHLEPTISLARTAVGEFGWDGAAAAFALVDPKNRLAIYFATETFNCQYAYHTIHPYLRDLVCETLGIGN